MDPKTVHERRDDVQVLDVRDDEEWAAGRIEGAHHIPLDQLAARVGELDGDRPVVTVCRTDRRAGRAASLLTRAGWTAQTMDGGMTRWASDGMPVTTPEGRPGRIV